jgi:hypothetical protein
MVVGRMGQGHELEVLSKKGLSHPQEVVRVGLETMRLDGDKVPHPRECRQTISVLQSWFDVIAGAKTAGSRPITCHVTVEQIGVLPQGDVNRMMNVVSDHQSGINSLKGPDNTHRGKVSIHACTNH